MNLERYTLEELEQAVETYTNAIESSFSYGDYDTIKGMISALQDEIKKRGVINVWWFYIVGCRFFWWCNYVN